MYTPRQLLKGLRNPRLIKSEIHNQLDDKAWPVYNRVSRRVFGRNSPPLPDCDWDNILLLDACRYGTFEKLSSLPGELRPRYTLGSHTGEYVRRTFKGRKCPDIVCVTANPKYYESNGGLNLDDNFHDVYHVWKDDWDEEHHTVLPDIMSERVLEAAEEYPDKRILAHYLQPHYPYIGDFGKSIKANVRMSDGLIEAQMEHPSLDQAMKDGVYDRESVIRAYKETLDITLSAVEKPLRELPGKTVVTSDHGEAFGRLREFGLTMHPRNRHIKSLIKVPWHVYQNGERKAIIEDGVGTGGRERISDEVVRARLQDIGYVD